MNLVADENIDKSLVERLRAEGHVLFYTAEVEPSIDDAAVLAIANERQEMLLTEDN